MKTHIKNILTITGVSLLFFLCSCQIGTVQGPQIIDRTPDIMRKPTQSRLNNQTIVDVPNDTILSTGIGKFTAVTLENDTVGQVRNGILDKKDVTLPKNTEITIPPNTPLRTTSPIKVTMESGAEVTLPIGTEITTSKFNWYAILFYCLLTGAVAWYFIQMRKSLDDVPADTDTTAQAGKIIPKVKAKASLKKQ